jgi:ribosomal protein S12 methylthiotransferase
VRAQRFERLGVFTYSHEENTHAYGLEDDVPADVKAARQQAVMEVQREISLERNESMIGETLSVIIDRSEGDAYIGRTEFDSPDVDNEVRIEAPGLHLKRGTFVTARIIGATEYDLEAELV